MERRFPVGFLWGAATASHQVEGGTTNDWTRWEEANAKRLAREAISHFGHLPGWKAHFGEEASNPTNYHSDTAVDHYHRYEEDFDIAKSLHHTAHRFSIEWSRIEPEKGVWDETAIDHYIDVIDALRTRGIEPFVTIWHWTLPLWLADEGGMLASKFPEYFARYADKLARSLPNVRFWITINEPLVITSHVYLKKQWPPQERCPRHFLRAFKNLVRAHRLSYDAMKKIHPEIQIGIAKHQVSFEIGHDTFWSRFLRKSACFFWNKWFLNKISDKQDFIGLNHYNRNIINNWFGKNPNERLTDIGWELYPESIYQSLVELKPYGKPIYITENGLADADDTLRKEFLQRSLLSVHKAIEDGADIRGYLHWSLLDNFEWDKGFWPRFGLIEVDRKTMKRTVRPSARYYADICKQNAIETKDPE